MFKQLEWVGVDKYRSPFFVRSECHTPFGSYETYTSGEYKGIFLCGPEWSIHLESEFESVTQAEIAAESEYYEKLRQTLEE